jgi:hypothetical protein
VDQTAAENAKGIRGKVSDRVTRMFPKRVDELLDGGSLYWVIKGGVLARQRIVGLEDVLSEDGVTRCAILLAPALVETQAQPRRAFQGWRYLKDEDAPSDLEGGRDAAPPALRARLAELGLI